MSDLSKEGLEAAYTDGPFFYMPMPINAEGTGPEMDAAKVVRVQHEVWNGNNLSVAIVHDEPTGRWLATQLNLSVSPPVEAGAGMREDIAKFNSIIDQVEARCMAVDGPVTPTLQEMGEAELSDLWHCVQRIRAAIAAAERAEG